MSNTSGNLGQAGNGQLGEGGQAHIEQPLNGNENAGAGDAQQPGGSNDVHMEDAAPVVDPNVRAQGVEQGAENAVNNGGAIADNNAVVAAVVGQVGEQLGNAIAGMARSFASNAQREANSARTGKFALQKELRVKFPAPEKETWSPETSHKYCKSVSEYLLARDFALDSKDAALWGFKCLPDNVMTHITPAGTELHPLWEGGVAFASWREVVAAVKSRYGAQAQQRILDMLHDLSMTQGKVKEYKEEFFKLLKELDEGYKPSANELLNILQAAMYPELAAEEAVKWSSTADNLPVCWKPSEYLRLIDVCVNVDEALAEVAAKKKAAKSKTTAKATVGVKRKNGASGSAEGASEGPSGGPSGGPSKKKRKGFSAIKWKDPQVQAAADAGRCINCLVGKHLSRDCPEKFVKRERLQGSKGPQGANGKGPKDSKPVGK